MSQDCTRGLGLVDETAEPGTPANPLHKIATLPNLVTLLRLILTVLFLFLYPNDSTHTAAVVLFIVAACTDWVDGKLARGLKQVSVFGKRFDPVMDRVLIFSGVIALLITGRIPLWTFVYLAVRDGLLLVGGAILMKTRRRIPDVCYIGKACTFILMAGFSVLLFDLFEVPGLGVFECAFLPGFGSASVSFGIWMVYVGCVLSVIAACVYIVRGVRIMRSPASGSNASTR
jgi:cardiolipin synthase (CMP-forming)